MGLRKCEDLDCHEYLEQYLAFMSLLYHEIQMISTTQCHLKL